MAFVSRAKRECPIFSSTNTPASLGPGTYFQPLTDENQNSNHADLNYRSSLDMPAPQHFKFSRAPFSSTQARNLDATVDLDLVTPGKQQTH